MASDIWLRTILIVREETRCRHIGYSFRLATKVLLYAPSHRQDSTYHGFCYTSRGALAGTRNSSFGSTPCRIDPTTNRTSRDTVQYTIMLRRKEGNVLFNDPVDTFYLRLYGIAHVANDQSDSERGNSLPPRHGLLFPISIISQTV